MTDSMLTAYALQFVGTFYRWGGDDPMAGWDCSGFVQELLAAMGKDPKGDQTAQGLFDYFSDPDRGWMDHAEPGSLVFYGAGRKAISHVAMLLDRDTIIEAGGGNRSIQSAADAALANAYVRVRKLANRKDLVAVIFPL
jgi:cell wall-associated NlpC family hydrolase